MAVTDPQARRLATFVFVLVSGFYVLSPLALVAARLAHGDGWTWPAPLTETFMVVLSFSFPLVGYLIARQQPRNAVGWVMLGVGLLLSLPTGVYVEYGHDIDPGSLPGVTVVAALTSAGWAPVIGLIGTFIILLFPDGHLPSRKWRGVAWFSGSAIAWVYLLVTFAPGELEEAGIGDVENPLGLAFIGPLEPVLLPTIVVLPISMMLCAAGLVVRFRRSIGRERQQLKWLATAGAIVAAGYALAMAASLIGNGSWSNDPLWLRIIQNGTLLSFALIPIAIGVAILKHGLYDIDVVINKALVFGVLAAFITFVYIAIVVGVGRLLGGGDRPNVVLSIAATTLVAVAFQPVRERVQRFANRLVYGRRATPYEVLSQFADRVGGAYDATRLLPLMAQTVGQGVGASRAEVWLATDDELVREAAWPEAADLGELVSLALDAVPGDRVVAVRHRGELLGALSVTKPAGEELGVAEVSLLDDVAAQAGVVLRNVRLVEELRDSRERLMSSQDDERRRLERRLHEGAQQRLHTVADLLRMARAAVSPDDAGAQVALDQLADQLRGATEDLGELARGIHPAVLTELGLGAALRSLAGKVPGPVTLEVDLDGELPPTTEATIYFVAAEALTNVAKYAHATQVRLTARRHAGSVLLEVVDDGMGGVDDTRGSGIRGLRDRVAAVDGVIEIHSPPGGGTRLSCSIPVRTTPRSSEMLALAGRDA